MNVRQEWIKVLSEEHQKHAVAAARCIYFWRLSLRFGTPLMVAFYKYMAAVFASISCACSLTKKHLRRSVIRTDDWFHALRIAVACTECHAWADQRERDESEAIIEGVIQNRHRELGLSEADAKKARKAMKRLRKDAEKSIRDRLRKIAADAQRGIVQEIRPCPIKFTDMTCEEFAREEHTLEWWPDEVE